MTVHFINAGEFANTRREKFNSNALFILSLIAATRKRIDAGEIRGPQGSQGAVGAQGGSQGPQGSTGPKGSTGSSGFQGTTGAQGDTGAQGSQGFQGATGATGVVGDTGAQGPQGSQGNPGAQGSKGVQGPNGLAIGVQGAPGIAGTQGQAGVAGAQGAGYIATSTTSRSIGIGTKVFDVAAGLAYQVGMRIRIAASQLAWMEGTVNSYGSNSLSIFADKISEQTGTFSDWKINLAGELGSDGSTGALGATGPQGLPGDSGVAGAQGPQGAQTSGLLGDAGTRGRKERKGRREMQVGKDVMTSHKRGVVYMVWGDSVNGMLNRSIKSLSEAHPDLPIEIIRIDAKPGLSPLKAQMADRSPFDTTLFLDADTQILGNLDFAFERAEQFGLACCICEAPFMRRYGFESEREQIEYNTGVIFFTRAAHHVFDRWQKLSAVPSRSHWRMLEDAPGYRRGLEFDDQAGFARALVACEFNPYVLPINYNLRPTFHRSFFAPIKIYHDYSDVPAVVRETSRKVERGELPITYIQL